MLFGYTEEELRVLVTPMASSGAEPIGSMGTDTPVAALSDRSRLLYDYFGQLFAQVTNPPLDAIREELVTSLGRTLRPGAEPAAGRPRRPAGRCSCRSRSSTTTSWPRSCTSTTTATCPVSPPSGSPATSTSTAAARRSPRRVEQLRTKVSKAIAAGARIIVLSDRDCDEKRAPIPSLLMTAAVHHHLVREKTRMEVGLVVESGDCREVHHVALLLGYGAAAVNPYLAFESIEDLIRDGALTGVEPAQAVRNMVKALGKGVLKVMSKMGISTVGSYTMAQIFEAVGLSQDLVDEYFTGTSCPLGGVGIDVLAEEVAMRHRRAYPREPDRAGAPPAGDRRRVPVAPRGRGAPVQPRDGVPAPARHPLAAVRRLRAVHGDRRQAVGGGRDPARALHAEDRRPAARADRGGRAGQRDRQAVQHRRDELRLHLAPRRTRRSRSR